MAQSTLTLAFTQTQKSLVITGIIAIRESVTVTVTGGASLITDTLVLKIQSPNNGGATTPIAILSTWEISGSDAVGTLNMNTTQAVAAFANAGNESLLPFNILLYTSGVSSLMANACICIKNFPSVVTSDPVSISQVSTIDELDSRITALEDSSLFTTDFSSVSALSTTSATPNQTIAKINEILTILKGM